MKIINKIQKAIVDHWNRINDKWRFLYASLVLCAMIFFGVVLFSLVPTIALIFLMTLAYLFNGLLILLIAFDPPWEKRDWLVVPLWLPAFFSGKLRDWIMKYDR